MSVEQSSLKISKFDGKRANYAMWESQFVAILGVKGCAAALQPNFKAKLPATGDISALNLSDAGQKAQYEALVKNNLAMSYLTVAMNSPSLLRIVQASKTSDFPDGLAYKVMDKLEKKYKPKDVMADAEQMEKLMKLEVGPRQDPDELGDQIAAIENEYGSQLDEKQKIAAVVKAAGRLYAAEINSTTNRITTGGGTVTAEDLIEACNESWRISGNGKSKTTGEGEVPNEATLGSTPGQFNGSCYKCGEKGHKAFQCGQQQQQRFNGKCHECGRNGHKRDDCWELAKNAHRRPTGYVPKKKEAAATNVEILIANVEKNDSESVDGGKGIEYLLANVDNKSDVTVNWNGTTDDEVTARGGSGTGVTGQVGTGTVAKNEMTAHGGSSIVVTGQDGTGIVEEKKVTAHGGCGIVKVTGQVGTGTAEKVIAQDGSDTTKCVTVHSGNGTSVDYVTALRGGGTLSEEMIAQVGGDIVDALREYQTDIMTAQFGRGMAEALTAQFGSGNTSDNMTAYMGSGMESESEEKMKDESIEYVNNNECNDYSGYGSEKLEEFEQGGVSERDILGAHHSSTFAEFCNHE